MTEKLEDIFMKNYGYSYNEAVEAKHNLVGFFSLLYEIDQEQKRKKQNQKRHEDYQL